MQVRAWDKISTEAMSKETITALYQPERAYRISEYSYPAGAQFHCAMREGTCYVLAGACKYTSDRSISIRVGEFVTLPQGQYQVEVGPADQVTLVMVWELPIY